MSTVDTAQWFESMGKCRCGCGKAATGTLRSYFHNSSLGPYAEKCAAREIARCHKLKKFEPDSVVREKKS